MQMKSAHVFAAALVLLLALSSMASAQTLDEVQNRGRIVCGANNALPGFGYVDSDGVWSGFDVDFCRAIAAAVLGDPEAVEYVPLTAAQRQPAIQTGEVDVMIRNTTWTLTRDTEWSANYAPTTFYDGQGFMVRADLGVETIEDLAGAAVCVTRGTTTELNLADAFRARGLPFEAVVFEEVDTVYDAYEQGRCDAVTSDTSQLASRRAIFADPDAHIILADLVSKEPLGPMVRHGDDQWLDIVTWVVNATFYAEEAGITSENVENFPTDNPQVARFLGATGTLGEHLGLDAEWAKRVIASVGNYGEIFERNLSPLGIPRGLNQQWTDGGLIFSPPFN